jgi:glutaminyl-tRNA synthetase
MPKIPRQIEFGRLSIENTVMSKRYLRQLVEEGKVMGWDDPRMPTLQGLRRRGYTPEAIRKFVLSTGLSKVNSTAGNDMLEAAIRDDLAEKAKRVMAIINPLKVTITNYEADKVEYFEVPFHSEQLELGSREIPFSKHLYIEADDFIVSKPNNKFKRLSLGDEVRLFHSYFIKAIDVKYDTLGNVIEVLATYDPATRSGSGFNERKPNGTIHYVEATTAVPATFNFFGPMIIGDDDMALSDRFNQDSWTVKQGFVERALASTQPQDKFQFMRNGYFNTDLDSKEGHLILNEIVPLKSSYK